MRALGLVFIAALSTGCAALRPKSEPVPKASASEARMALLQSEVETLKLAIDTMMPPEEAHSAPVASVGMWLPEVAPKSLMGGLAGSPFGSGGASSRFASTLTTGINPGVSLGLIPATTRAAVCLSTSAPSSSTCEGLYDISGTLIVNSGSAVVTAISGTTQFSINNNGKISQSYLDSSGTPGNVTSNNNTGLVAVAGAASAVTLTNNKITATSFVVTTVQTTDATCTSVKSAIPAAGSAVITMNAACTGTTKVSFWVVGV